MNIFSIFDKFSKTEPVDRYAGFNRAHIDGTENEHLNYMANAIFDGEKFPGGFGQSFDYSCIDYYELRRKSSQLILENPYALGALRRILSNEINNGLSLEANIRGLLLGLSEDEAQDISEQIEIDWKMFCNNPVICDNKQERTLHKIMYSARKEALVEGDCLVTMRIHNKTKLPVLDVIPGRFIIDPINSIPDLNSNIDHGVELDSNGKQIAYHVEQKDGTTKRIPAYGSKTGRRIAWMIYASDRRVGESRGLPFLSNAFYALKELDRYRDSEQRAAFVNSIVAGFIKRTQPTKANSLMTNNGVGGGTTKDFNDDGSIKETSFSRNLPGVFFDRLGQGEEPVSYDAKRPNVNFSAFEASILRVFFWMLGIPPEIGMLEFKNNFSASRQADNEFSVYLKESVRQRGAEFYQPIYETFLYQSALLGKYSAKLLVDVWGDESKWDIYGSWVNADWTGLSRPSVDIMKDVNAMEKAILNNFATADFATRRICGMSYNDVINQRKKEKKALEKAGLIIEQEEKTDEQKDNDILNNNILTLSTQFEEIQEALSV